MVRKMLSCSAVSLAWYPFTFLTALSGHDALRTLSAPSLRALQQGQNSSNTAAQPMASVSSNITAAGNQAPQTIHQEQTVPTRHPQPQSTNQPVFLPTMAAPNAPMYVTAGPGPTALPFQMPGLTTMQYQAHVPPHLYPGQVQQFPSGSMGLAQHVPWLVPGPGPSSKEAQAWWMPLKGYRLSQRPQRSEVNVQRFEPFVCTKARCCA